MLELLFGAKRRFLDSRRDVTVAVAPVRLSSTYRGPLMRVRRSSDNLEADFAVGQSDLNWGDIAGFVGGGTGFVSCWYDQSGNGRHFAQASASRQPQVGLLSNGLPGIVFPGAGPGINLLTPNYGLTQPWTGLFCLRYLANGSSQDFFDGIVQDAAEIWNSVGTQAPRMDAITGGITVGVGDMPLNARGILGAVFNGASSVLAVTSSQVNVYTGSTGTTAPGGHVMGTEGSSNFPMTGEVTAAIAFNTAHSTGQLSQELADLRNRLRF